MSSAEEVVNAAAAATGGVPKKAHVWDRHPRDWYVEPPWCSERLFAMGVLDTSETVWDPAAGMGRIPTAARAAGMQVHATDIEPRGHGISRWDFFKTPPEPCGLAIVSNPPFGRAQDFVNLALLCSHRVIMLLPAGWIQGEARAKWLQETPLQRVLFICPRPSMPPGELVQAGEKPGNGSRDYAWFVWVHGFQGEPRIGWCIR